MAHSDFDDLKRELAELGIRRHALKDHELFSVWFLRAAVTDDEEGAVNALTGTSGEKGVDALLIDDAARAVFVVQSKYHKAFGKTNEPRSEVMAFADVAGQLYGSDEEFATFCQNLEPIALRKARHARERLLNRTYRLQCFYATTNRCAAKLAKEAEAKVRRVQRRQKPSLEVYDSQRIMLLLRNYLAGAAPPIPYLEILVQDTLQEGDPATGIEAWVCSMRGDLAGGLLETAGERIFARNIRGYLGETKVNERIRDTIEHQPQRFWHFNNGITIVCDSATEERGGGQSRLSLNEPQIINGQQTTRTLHDAGRKARHARVAVRVISISRAEISEQKTYDDLVSQIVEATNWQNAISSADLRANDRRQIEIERELRRLGYFYIRKRQAKSEARGSAPRHMTLVSKENLMRAGASCLSPNLPLQKPLQRLFEEDYGAVFKRSTRTLLSQHVLFRECGRAARGSSSRKYGKFIVCYIVWDAISTDLRTNLRNERFVEVCAPTNPEQAAVSLRTVVEAGFKAVDSYYTSERGTGVNRVEPSNFFKRRDAYKHFDLWLDAKGARHGDRFSRATSRFRTDLRA